MNRRIATKIAKRARLFINSWTWAFDTSGPVPTRQVFLARKILSRRFRHWLRAETHIVQDGRLFAVPKKNPTDGDRKS